MITNDMYKKACNSAIYFIKRVFTVNKYEYYIVYNRKAIEIISKSENEMTRIYCRIVYTQKGFIIDISNIALDESIQRKGMFTKVITELSKSKTLKEIWVSSVLTDEMHLACRKTI